jgi:uncharacterized membrane protein
MFIAWKHTILSLFFRCLFTVVIVVFMFSSQHFTDNSRFDRDNPPCHPIQDDSAWYLNFPGELLYIEVTDDSLFEL